MAIRNVTATTTAGLFADAHPGRQTLMVQNNGAATLYIGLGAAPTATTGIQVPANTRWEPPVPPEDAIWLLAASGTLAVAINEA